MYTLRLKRADNFTVTLRKMTMADTLKLEEIQKKKEIEIYKTTIFAMFGLVDLLIMMIFLYNLNL